MAQICTISDEVLDAYKKFKLAKNPANNAMILKVDTKTLTVVVDQTLDSTPIEGVQEELPDAAPRYIIYSYKYEHRDGRTAFPLCLIYYNPPQIKPELCMMYSSALQPLVRTLSIAKVFDIRKPSELEEDWLKSKLAFFQ
eukprot:TRINITY_DN1160_c0_g1_i1.p1 TRINITY_DN1160_c0_g1~~TRINITY_DN1160_c0_g1_i1.p1  ORF type:complete len:140 (+),score=37.91 TRINITY_DN1160_c0_g1_i1:8-427(+)